MLLEKVKLSLRVTDPDFDEEIQDLIESAEKDLKNAGIVKWNEETDPLIRKAIITYCNAYFGSPANYQDLKASYESQKLTLMYSFSEKYTKEADDEQE